MQALEHIPPILPKVEADSDDDLTPPPIEISTFMPDHIETSAAEPKKRKRASAKKLIYAESPEPSEVLEEQEKPRKGRKKAVGKTQSADEEFKAVNDAEDADITGSLKKKKATPKKKVENGEEGDKPKKKATPKKSRLISKDEAEFDSEGNEIVKKQRKPKVYPKIEYDILPVERKETTFKGESR